jgi:hypothetical protein
MFVIRRGLIFVLLIIIGCDYLPSAAVSPSKDIPLDSLISVDSSKNYSIDFMEMVFEDCFFWSGSRVNKGRIPLDFREDLNWLELGLAMQTVGNQSSIKKKRYRSALANIKQCRHIFPTRSMGESAYLDLLHPDARSFISDKEMLKHIGLAIAEVAPNNSLSDKSFLMSAWLLLHNLFPELKSVATYNHDLNEIKGRVLSLRASASESSLNSPMCWEMLPLAYLRKLVSKDLVVDQAYNELKERLVLALQSPNVPFYDLGSMLPCLAALRISAPDKDSFANSLELKLILERFLVHLFDGEERKGSCEGSGWFLHEFRFEEEVRRICNKNPRLMSENVWLYMVLSNLPPINIALTESVIKKIGLSAEAISIATKKPLINNSENTKQAEPVTLQGLLNSSSVANKKFPQSQK